MTENEHAEERGHLSLLEAARYLNMSVGAVGRWARNRRISSVTPEGALLFRLEDLDAVSVRPTEADEVS